MSRRDLHPALAIYCDSLAGEFDLIGPERRVLLKGLGQYISEKQQYNRPLCITVICTHNSRRSHMGQLWLQAAAIWYDIQGLQTFSGGTETTAFHPNAIAALQRAGFHIRQEERKENPVYRATTGPSAPEIKLFSKKFDHQSHPTRYFAALMVCAEADAACPLVPGAEIKISLPFEDPKYYDGTPTASRAYDDTCRLMARELFFAMEHSS